MGATGAVGTIIREILEERRFPFKKIRFLASKRSAGTEIQFADQTCRVEELTPEIFDEIDLAIASTPDETAEEFIPGRPREIVLSSMRAGTGEWSRTFPWWCPR